MKHFEDLRGRHEGNAFVSGKWGLGVLDTVLTL